MKHDLLRPEAVFQERKKRSQFFNHELTNLRICKIFKTESEGH